MQRIVLASTDLGVSRLGFGTASLHHLYRTSERISVLSAALDAGFTHFDTAPMYGEGMAERTLGKFLSQGRRHSVTLTTKIGMPSRSFFEAVPQAMWIEKAALVAMRRAGISTSSARERSLSKENCEKSLKRSLEALQTDWVDLLMIHEPLQSQVSGLHQLAEWLYQQKAQGRARYIGMAGRAENCVAIAKELPGLFDVLQVENSIEFNEAELVLRAGWPLQITYGYMRRNLEQGPKGGSQGSTGSIRTALSKNPNGMILVSTRKKHRLQELAKIVGESRAI